MWRGSHSSHKLPLIPHLVLGKRFFFTEFIEYLKLKRTHMDHCVQLLALHWRPPNNLTQCLKALSKHVNLSNPRGTYPSQNEGPTAPHPR